MRKLQDNRSYQNAVDLAFDALCSKTMSELMYKHCSKQDAAVEKPVTKSSTTPSDGIHQHDDEKEHGGDENPIPLDS